SMSNARPTSPVIATGCLPSSPSQWPSLHWFLARYSSPFDTVSPYFSASSADGFRSPACAVNSELLFRETNQAATVTRQPADRIARSLIFTATSPSASSTGVNLLSSRTVASLGGYSFPAAVWCTTGRCCTWGPRQDLRLPASCHPLSDWLPDDRTW